MLSELNDELTSRVQLPVQPHNPSSNVHDMSTVHIRTQRSKICQEKAQKMTNFYAVLTLKSRADNDNYFG